MEYADVVNPNLICCICHQPFTRPVTLRQCGHTFCRGCLDELLDMLEREDRSARCPVDRLEISSSSSQENSTQSTSDRSQLYVDAPLLVQNMVQELRVYCPHRSDGCEHPVVERQHLDTHLRNDCLYHTMRCVDCSVELERRHWEDHVESQCEYRPWTCEECQSVLAWRDRVTFSQPYWFHPVRYPTNAIRPPAPIVMPRLEPSQITSASAQLKSCAAFMPPLDVFGKDVDKNGRIYTYRDNVPMSRSKDFCNCINVNENNGDKKGCSWNYGSKPWKHVHRPTAIHRLPYWLHPHHRLLCTFSTHQRTWKISTSTRNVFAMRSIVTCRRWR